jgi:hypothetical protein
MASEGVDAADVNNLVGGAGLTAAGNHTLGSSGDRSEALPDNHPRRAEQT